MTIHFFIFILNIEITFHIITIQIVMWYVFDKGIFVHVVFLSPILSERRDNVKEQDVQLWI